MSRPARRACAAELDPELVGADVHHAGLRSDLVDLPAGGELHAEVDDVAGPSGREGLLSGGDIVAHP